MIFLLREVFKRRGMEGYNTIHHFADIGLTAGAGAGIALMMGGDTASSRAFLENSVFVAGPLSVMLAFRTAAASEPNSKLPRFGPFVTKLVAGSLLGVAIAATPLLLLPGPDGATLKEGILQDNQDYEPLRKRQKAGEKAQEQNVSHETFLPPPAAPILPPMNGIFPAHIRNFLAEPQKRGPGL